MSYFENRNDEIYTSYYDDVHSFKSHFHNKLEIAHCLSGVQKVKIGEQLFTMKKGDSVIIFPNIIHEYVSCEPLKNENTQCICLICNTGLLTKNIPQLITSAPKYPFIESKRISENVRLSFQKMLDIKNTFELTGWAYIAISELMERIELMPLNDSSDLKLAPKIVSYIHENFKKPLTLKYLSKEFGYSSSYIAHIFCDRLKVPFRTYLGAVRCEYVAEQIKNTDKSLTEIAFEAGYDSLNTFCRCFKKHFNKTPSQYKKELK